MTLGLFAWLVPVLGPVAAAAVVAALAARESGSLGLDGGYAVGATLVLVATVVARAAAVLESTETLVAALTLVLTGSLALVRRLDDPGGRWGQRLRSRLVMGLPLGTLTSVAVVLSVYLLLQGGATAWTDPVTLPFRAWSLLYPFGLLTAAFSHNGASHLVGNLTGTLVVGSLAEYAWGHFPRERGASSFGSLPTNPLARAVLIFPGVVLVVGLLTSLFSLGPVIGFSGVVFAFVGFALVRYPLGTVIGVVGVDAVRLAYVALQRPVLVREATPTPPSAPWWAEIAIQAHALGLLIGVVLGLFVFTRRAHGPSALRLWTGALLLGVEQSLWAVYWFRGNETYVLYRGPGVVFVVVLALLVATALTAPDRPLRDLFRRDEDGDTTGADRPAAGPAEADGGRDVDAGPPPRDDDGSRPRPASSGDGDGDGTGGLLSNPAGDPKFTWRTVAVVVVLVGLGVLAGPGVGSKAFTVADDSVPGNESEQVVVDDYTVGYAEDVRNRRVAIVDVGLFDETTAVRTSGVIVASPDRQIWRQAVSTRRLAFDGEVDVALGGAGWRHSVTAVRRGWSADGGGTAYIVWLDPEDGERRTAFRSDPATADDRVAGRNVSVVPGEDGFFVLVERSNDSVDTAPVPAVNDSVTAGGLTLTNRENDVYASIDDTRVRVLSKEEYE
jgi:membrane associated rhomboid family serine protease